MADSRALTLQSGVVQQVGDADVLLVGVSVDRATAGSLSIGSSTATAITIGSGGVSPSFPGGIDLSGSDFTLNSVDIQWTDTGGALHTIDSVQSASDTAGSGLDVRAGQGGNSSTATAQAGGGVLVEGGTGGAGTGQDGGNGGQASLVGGVGGEATGGGTGGSGGTVYVTGGAGGNGGTSGATDGGSVFVNGGAGQGGGTDGSVSIGTSDTDAITIGNATDNPNTAFSGTGYVQIDGHVRGPNDGTGVVIGHAGTQANEGSAYQAVSLTTTERGYLVAANGMVIYNETDSQLQGYANGSWVDLGAAGSSPWTLDTGVIYPNNTTDDVVIGATAMSGTEKLRVVGAVLFDITDNDASAFVVQQGNDGYIVVDTGDGAEEITIGNTATNPDVTQVGTGQVTFGGNIDANNGVDVDGIVTISEPTGNTAVLDMTDGGSASVSATDHGRIRYNETTDLIEKSENGGAYSPVNAPDATIVEDATTTTTTSATDTQMANMTATPAAGTYLVHFQGSLNHNVNAAQIFTSIYAGGTQVAASEREYHRGAAQGDVASSFACMAIVTVNGAQAIQGQWRTNTATATCYEHQLMYMRVA